MSTYAHFEDIYHDYKVSGKKSSDGYNNEITIATQGHG